jgi:glycosyltransferase involved in cell wall biosynthesis
MTALFERATARLAISDAMAQEYETRFGRPFVGVHNPVDLQRWDALAAREPDTPAGAAVQTRVVYAGRVGRANADSIADVAQVVGAMAAAGARVGMDIYTGDWSRADVARLGDLAGVHVHPGVAYERIPALMRAADVLLLPLDFDAEAAGFARLSMPTKVSEYLASGRPTLTYAPAGSAATEYARAGGWSVVVDRRDPSALRDALATLAADPALRQEMGLRARRCAETDHDASRVREQFRAALSDGAGPPHS